MRENNGFKSWCYFLKREQVTLTMNLQLLRDSINNMEYKKPMGGIINVYDMIPYHDAYFPDFCGAYSSCQRIMLQIVFMISVRSVFRLCSFKYFL